MHSSVEVRIERERGCGYRRPSGLYLVADGPFTPCGKLPILLEICPCCSQGIRPTRGWQWIDVGKIAGDVACQTDCKTPCPLRSPPSRAGLLWVGKAYYETPARFLREAAVMGISRRVARIPRDFELGVTFVALAHRRAIVEPCSTLEDCDKCKGTGLIRKAGIFSLFKPTRVEFVVRGDETDEEIEALLERGVSPIHVIKDRETLPLFPEA